MTDEPSTEVESQLRFNDLIRPVMEDYAFKAAGRAPLVLAEERLANGEPTPTARLMRDALPLLPEFLRPEGRAVPENSAEKQAMDSAEVRRRWRAAAAGAGSLVAGFPAYQPWSMSTGIDETLKQVSWDALNALNRAAKDEGNRTLQNMIRCEKRDRKRRKRRNRGPAKIPWPFWLWADWLTGENGAPGLCLFSQKLLLEITNCPASGDLFRALKALKLVGLSRPLISMPRLPPRGQEHTPQLPLRLVLHVLRELGCDPGPGRAGSETERLKKFYRIAGRRRAGRSTPAASPDQGNKLLLRQRQDASLRPIFLTTNEMRNLMPGGGTG